MRQRWADASEQGVAFARQFRAERGLGNAPIGDLATYLIRAGATLAMRTTAPREPLCTTAVDGVPHIIVGDHMTRGGTRYWLAHALGHCVFGDPLPRACPPSRFNDQEARALGFAAELLVPVVVAADVRSERLIARVFGVTETFAARRIAAARRTCGVADRRMSVLVDHREVASGVPDLLAMHADLHVRCAALPVGDYVLGDDVVVERKTHADLVASVRDGRLLRQLGRLRGVAPQLILLLESEGPTGMDGLGDPQRRGLFIAAVFNAGASIVPSRGPGDTALLLAAIARRVESGVHGSAERAVGRSRQARKREVAPSTERVLCAVQGIGPVRARALLAGFGSLKAVLTACEAELVTVGGLSPLLARRLLGLTG